MTNAVKGAGTSEIGFHAGRTLLSVSNRYPSLFDALLELIQNSIGANARNVWVKLNRRTRSLVEQDDGDGVTREFFDKALKEVCYSQRTIDEYGRFGMGLYSPLAKCEHYTLTSCPRGVPQGYIEWSFRASEIEQVAKDLKIGWQPTRQYRFVEGATKQRGADVPWRTQVRLYKYTPDRRLSRVEMDALEAAILDRFIVKMRKNRVVVHVSIVGKDGCEEQREIRALDFRGQKLDEKVITSPEAGRTTFRMYLAPQFARAKAKEAAGRSRVLIGLEGDPHRINFETFIQHAPNLLSGDTVEAIRSGVFEGEIITTKPTLAEHRKAFEDNDALVGFYDAVETWYGETGSQYFERVRDTKREERFQQLTLPVLEWLAEQLRSGELPEVEELIGSFQRGTVGPGHVQPRRRDVVGEEQGLSLAAGHGALAPHSGNGNGGSSTDPSEERTGHTPLAVTGPRGSRRTIVKHGSLGITVVYDDPEILHMRNLCKLDVVQGRLLVNTQHPDWVKCEKGGDRMLQQLIALLMIIYLHAYSQDPELLSERLAWADESIKVHIAVMLSSDAIRRFRPKTAKAVLTKTA